VNGHSEILRTLLDLFRERGLSKELNAKNSAGNTPLRTKGC
jgi:hypothetical protein